MNEQPSGEAARNKALHLLVQSLGLSPEEVSQLRLTHLRLAGKNPNLSFSTAEQPRPKTVELDLEAHRALVGWLVVRPDVISDFLFPGDGADPLEPAVVQQIVDAVEAERPAWAGNTRAEQKTTPLRPVSMPEPPEQEDLSHRPAPGMPFNPKPPPVRPSAPFTPPRSAPERGAPPGFESRRIPPYPPPRAPEADEVTGTPGRTGPPPSSRPVQRQPFPPPPESERAGAPPVSPLGREAPSIQPKIERELKPAPKPVERKKADQAPPKSVRKRDTTPDPVLMESKEQEVAPPPASVTPVEPPAPEPAPPVTETQPPTPAPAAAERAMEAKQAPRPEADKPKQPIPETARPAEAKPADAAEPIVKPAAAPAATEMVRPALFSFALGGFLGVLLLCVVCVGGFGWLVMGGETQDQLLASLGLAGAEPGEDLAEATDEAEAGATEETTFESPVVAANSPLATPTLPPTDTPTSLPATDTPVPTDTPVAETFTPTPPPTDTPAPTDTPTPEPPPATPTSEPPAPAEPAFKYGAPALLTPENGFKFIGNTQIIFRWQPVDLAEDEQYAIRVRYPFNGQIVYQGSQVREPQWEMPNALYRQIDPPLHRYEWFVVIERVNEDGTGTAISPQSEVRNFIWD